MVTDNSRLIGNSNRAAFSIQIIFIGIAFGTLCLAFVLAWLHSFIPPSSHLSADLLIYEYREDVNPEPTERFVFIILAIAVPIAALALSIASASRVTNEFLNNTIKQYKVAILVPLLVAILFFLPFLYSPLFNLISGIEIDEPNISYAITLLLFGAIALLWCFMEVSRIIRLPFLSKKVVTMIIGLVFFSSALLPLLAWRLLGINSVNGDFTWNLHTDALIYSLSQVLAGKTILVDLPSQYGLWAEMVAPLFGITGFSILGLTSLFALLQLTSLGSLFLVLSRLVKIPSLLAMSGIAIVVVTFETALFFDDAGDPYFQYWPVRFFWPAVSVLAFHFFSKYKTIFWGALVSLLGALGILWNFDSGLFIAVAYGAYLLARLTLLIAHRYRPEQPHNDPWTIKLYITALAAHVGITILVIASFFWLLMFKSGESLNISWIFLYQKIFYDLGLLMLPLPLQIHPWMSVLGLYLLGLLVAFHSWLNQPARSRMDTVFYLSMLGLGLFFYYQGRSHDLNLLNVCWPAVMIAAILADEHLRAIRASILPKTMIYLPVVAVFLFMLCCFNFMSHGILMLTSMEKAFSTRGVPDAPFVTNEIAFIKQYSTDKRECFILSHRQGIYYAEAGLASPIKGSGLVETLLMADQDSLLHLFFSGQIPCVFFGIGKNTRYIGSGSDYLISEKYSIVATNSENTIQYLELKP